MAHVLLIDGMAGIRRAVSAMLGRGGHTILLGKDSAAGLAAMRSERFDLVIAELVMPELAGIELLQAIAAMPVPPKVIVMSAVPGTTAEAALRAIGLEAEAFLEKPFAQEMLLAAVATLLRKAA